PQDRSRSGQQGSPDQTSRRHGISPVHLDRQGPGDPHHGTDFIDESRISPEPGSKIMNFRNVHTCI
ncbi:hypothetical protein, partial [Microvirga pakistanensis]|uniref:hypothetical protein n=1 Tax=Microvirga pakistanensis TaxID=1682650 RepID=UPI00195DACBA